MQSGSCQPDCYPPFNGGTSKLSSLSAASPPLSPSGLSDCSPIYHSAVNGPLVQIRLYCLHSLLLILHHIIFPACPLACSMYTYCSSFISFSTDYLLHRADNCPAHWMCLWVTSWSDYNWFVIHSLTTVSVQFIAIFPITPVSHIQWIIDVVNGCYEQITPTMWHLHESWVLPGKVPE